MSFTSEIIVRVWQKGLVDLTYDPAVWRKDVRGSWIKWNEYGNRNSEYGWEIDHIKPQALGGSDDISNLRPLHWQSNAARQVGRL